VWRPFDHAIAIGEINVGLAFLVEKSDDLETLENQRSTLTEDLFSFFQLTDNTNGTDLTTG